jgi:hypothetical protein
VLLLHVVAPQPSGNPSIVLSTCGAASHATPSHSFAGLGS